MANDKHGRFTHLVPLLKKHSSLIWIGAGVTIFANVLVLIVPYLIKLAFEAVEAGEPASVILRLCAYMVGLAVVGGAFRFAMRRTIIWASRKVEYDLRGVLFEKLLNLDPSYYHNTKTGDLMAHATNDVEAIRMMVGPGIMHIFNTLVSTCVAIAFMMTLSVKLTLFTILPMTLLSMSVHRLSKMAHKKYLAIQSYFSFLTSRVQENLAGVRVVKAYGREESEIENFSGVSRKYADLNLSLMKIIGLFHPMLFFIAGSVSLLILYTGGREVIADRISLGTLVAFFGYLSWLVWPMMALGWVVALYQRGIASLGRISKILDTEPNVADPLKASTSANEVKGKIEFRNLTFTYPLLNDSADKFEPVLKDINLTIEAGTRLGITGPTGSGKTSLVSLIPRLYPAENGQILIDDIDINLWPLKLLRQGIGFVPQETFLFSDTMEANIRFSADQPDQNGVAHAARLAALHDDIESFPGRYDTILGERGITLSGGQKQRAALARAIMREPAIMVLDDATSSVDTETEEAIFENFRKVLPGRTSIIISHRVASLKHCDLIIYLDDGRIIEQGGHEDLLAQNGAYALLHRRQMMEQQLEKM
ncbi:MAG: ABC transporter ATP-binding protein [FCB group bacterium]|nr:ABC transporter ATP-binding protein [FCB group bacterium]